jgi:hypothetical protein
LRRFLRRLTAKPIVAVDACKSFAPTGTALRAAFGRTFAYAFGELTVEERSNEIAVIPLAREQDCLYSKFFTDSGSLKYMQSGIDITNACRKQQKPEAATKPPPVEYLWEMSCLGKFP